MNSSAELKHVLTVGLRTDIAKCRNVRHLSCMQVSCGGNTSLYATNFRCMCNLDQNKTNESLDKTTIMKYKNARPWTNNQWIGRGKWETNQPPKKPCFSKHEGDVHFHLFWKCHIICSAYHMTFIYIC